MIIFFIEKLREFEKNRKELNCHILWELCLIRWNLNLLRQSFNYEVNLSGFLFCNSYRSSANLPMMQYKSFTASYEFCKKGNDPRNMEQRIKYVYVFVEFLGTSCPTRRLYESIDHRRFSVCGMLTLTQDSGLLSSTRRTAKVWLILCKELNSSQLKVTLTKDFHESEVKTVISTLFFATYLNKVVRRSL